MPFDPENVESDPGISADADAAEVSIEKELVESVEDHENAMPAQAHTIKVGSIG